jgi:hypothetical protein
MRHRAIRIVSVTVLCLLPLARVHAAALAPRTYVWLGEFVAADLSAKTLTVKARIPEHVGKYINRFKAGDRVMLVWDMIKRVEPNAAKTNESGSGQESARNTTEKSEPDAAKKSAADSVKKSGPAVVSPAVVMKTETDVVMYIDSYDAMKSSKVDSGYILPAEFVSEDTATVTLRLHVPDSTLQAVKPARPGQWIRATSPMSQPTEVAAIAAIDVVNAPSASTAAK